MTHLNNAGSSLPPTPVLDTMIRHLQEESRWGGYEVARRDSAALEQVYTSIAALIGAAPHEVALAESATRAWDMAFYAIPFAPGDRIITGVSEYASNYLAFLQVQKAHDVEIVVIPDDDAGELDLEALRRSIDDRTRLIAVTHVPTNGGVVNPAAEIGQIAAESGCLYLLDACQSVGQIAIDVGAIGCDFLSATGRKYLRGPRGTGFLYVNADAVAALHPPFIDLHAATWSATNDYELRPDARRFETWESSVACRLGLGTAADYALAVGVDLIEARVRELARHLRVALAEIPGVTVHDKGRDPCGIVTFSHDEIEASQLTARLRAQHINTHLVSASSTRLDYEQRRLPDLVRASVHYFNTDEELQLFTKVLQAMAGR